MNVRTIQVKTILTKQKGGFRTICYNWLMIRRW